MPRMNPRSVQTANGSDEGQVREDHAGQRVRQVVAGEHDVERDDEPDLRQHQDADHQDDEQLAAREAVLRERHRREEREHDRDRHRDADDDQAVLDDVPEVRARPSRRGSGRASATSENHVGVRPVDLVVRLERRRDHPEDREHERRRRRAIADEVPARARRSRRRRRRRAPAAAASPDAVLTSSPPCAPSGARRRRSGAATISSISSEIAAPRPKSECA